MSASTVEAREIQIAGRQLRCQVCDYTRFFRREAGLQTGASNAFGQDWTSSQASCFICEQCGYVHWFVRGRAATTAAEDSALAREIEALRQRLEDEETESTETLESTRR